MEFSMGFKKGQMDVVTLNKNQVHDSLVEIINRLNNDEKLGEFEGEQFAHILTYFQPPIKKSSDMAFITSALQKRKHCNGAEWKSFAKYTDGIGLHGSDGKRLHILKDFKPVDPEKIYFIPESKKWASEEEMKQSNIAWRYPDVGQVLRMQKECRQISVFGAENMLKSLLTPNPDNPDQYFLIYDNITITLNKKYVNDVVEVMAKGKLFIKDSVSSIFIEDKTKIVILMPVGKC